MKPRLFNPGHITATPGALDLMNKFQVDSRALLRRHLTGDWGVLSAEDVRENELSLEHGFRIWSSYPIGDDKVWVITEADRSSTTFLLPSEY